MTDYIKIHIDTLELKMRIGLLDHEREAPQRVIVSMQLYTEPKYLNTADKALIDYGVISEQVKAFEKSEHIELLETFMKDLLKIAFSCNGVEHADIKIVKPDIIEYAKGVGIETSLSRETYMATCAS